MEDAVVDPCAQLGVEPRAWCLLTCHGQLDVGGGDVSLQREAQRSRRGQPHRDLIGPHGNVDFTPAEYA